MANGLIKIGRTGSDKFENRMSVLERNGYRNVTGLKRTFAIEVDDYERKESAIHSLLKNERVNDTELFKIDVDDLIQILSCFEGKIVYPVAESKKEIFEEAFDNSKSKLIPDGTYTFEKVKLSDDKKTITAKATIKNGRWTLLKDSCVGKTEDSGSSAKAKEIRKKMSISDDGKLLEDVYLGECTPTFATNVIMNQSTNGWTDWKDENGRPIDVYRKVNHD